MRIVVGAEEGRRTVLRRQPLGEVEVPPAVRERTRAVFGADVSPAEAVARILRDVRTEGDAAVLRYSEALDGVTYRSLAVSGDEVKAAYQRVEPALVADLRFAADRIRRFHQMQMERCLSSFSEDGLGMLVGPLERVGMYALGATVVYPSSVLMTAIPAAVANVSEVYMVSPAGADGTVSPLKLVAADIAGVDGVFCASGAQAIAALAYGTKTIPRVDKVCGPGNIFVTLAKQQLYGTVGIDATYGPTETIVIADDSADPALCAADLLAQAEHDELASPILLTPSLDFARAVEREAERQLATLERAAIARSSLESRGGAVVTNSLDEALALANEFAPEHLCLLMRDAAVWAGRSAQRRRPLRRRVVAGGDGRLHGRPQPRHADRRQRPLLIAPERARLLEDNERRGRRRRNAAPARPGGGGNRPRRGLHGARPRHRDALGHAGSLGGVETAT